MVKRIGATIGAAAMLAGLGTGPPRPAPGNGWESDCKPLDAGNHAYWNVIFSANYKNGAWC